MVFVLDPCFVTVTNVYNHLYNVLKYMYLSCFDGMLVQKKYVYGLCVCTDDNRQDVARELSPVHTHKPYNH